MSSLRFSRSAPFHFEALRAMWYAPFDGADIGEVIAIMSKVKGGDFESWYENWHEMASRIRKRAERLDDSRSRGKALLRVSNYLRTAEFFLTGTDPRRHGTAAESRAAIDEAWQLLGVDAVRSTVDFDGAPLETIFLRARGGGTSKGVLVVHGGLDSTPDELYFTVGAGAIERGYDVLIFEGPGQGEVLRRHLRTFVPDWERPVAAVLDQLETYTDTDNVIGVGVSLGGHLLARAAAYESRYRAIVLLDYFPGMLSALTHAVPAPLTSAFLRMPPWMERLVRLNAKFDPQLRWALSQASWAFGATSPKELVARAAQFTEGNWVEEIGADVLMMVGEAEGFFDKDLAGAFADRLSSARSVELREFSATEGGHMHCRNGAIQLAHESMFEWIADVSTAAPAARRTAGATR